MVRERVVPIGLVIAVLAGWLLWVTRAPAEAADISAQLTRAAAAEKAGNHEAAIDALEQALESVRVEAPLVVKPFLVVARPAKFYGDYTPRANAVFTGSEEQQYYLEPKNLISRMASGSYEPAFEVDLQVLTADGNPVASQPRFGSFRLPAKSPVYDIYMNLKVTLEGAPAGNYNVRFIVRDLNSKKTATVTQRITIK
jgi:hypothetical protein